jgi:serine/threonine-protein kinase
MQTPIHCVRCGREAPGGARFCPACGLDLQDPRARLATGLLPSNLLLHGRYLILRKIAQGGQSAVYHAVDVAEGNRPRAVKEMSESNLTPAEREVAINDFIREANMLMGLNHPALAKVYTTFVESQKHYLVMEFVEGHNLEDELIQVGRPLEWERVLGWGIALCDVLEYLHAQQPPIIYRDLKPANVMLTRDGSIKLVDFGIARWLHPNRARDTAQLGTDGYAPLEQYSARSEPRSDLYALGASLYHLLTGRVPEAAPMRIAGQPLTPIRALNPRVPEAFERVILRVLNLHARERYENAAQMRLALQQLRPGQSAPGSRPTTAPIPARLTGAPRISGAPAPSLPMASGKRTGATGAPPRLSVWPLRLDAGYLDSNDTALLVLDVANRGGGELKGVTETNMHCLKAEPRVVDPNVTTLQVRIDTTGLPPGPYTCHLAVRTTGGDQIVPVRFVVRPQMDARDARRRQAGR